ncbi:MAG: hypothetical protein AAFU49_21915 [Pseudomonadota bacterium]
MSTRVTRLQENPQLGVVSTLSAQLELLPDVLAAVHGEGDAAELRDQARSIARVARILRTQLEAYEGLLGLSPRGRRR